MSKSNRPTSDHGLSCDEARVFLPLSIEDELDSVRTNLLFAHLDTCETCEAAYLEQSEERRWIAENLIKAPRLPSSFASKVCARIRAESPQEPMARSEKPAAQPLPKLVESEMAERASVVTSRKLRDALPWLTAAAMALFFVTLAGWMRGGAPGTSGAPSEDVLVANTPNVAARSAAFAGTAPGSTDETLAGASRNMVSTRRVIRSADFCSLEVTGVEPVHAGGTLDTAEGCASLDSIFPAEVAQDTSPKSNDPEEGVVARLARSHQSFGRVYVLTSQLASSTHGTTLSDADEAMANDPCGNDSNKDGALDYRDVTHMCQVLMQPALAECPRRVVALAGPSLDSTDCDEEDCI